MTRSTGQRIRGEPPPLRFNRYVIPEPNTGCFLWLGGRNQDGYGSFALPAPDRPRKQRIVSAHRYAYELELGPIPPGMTLDHLCRQRACVRVTHLEAVTLQENQRRGRLHREHAR